MPWGGRVRPTRPRVRACYACRYFIQIMEMATTRTHTNSCKTQLLFFSDSSYQAIAGWIFGEHGPLLPGLALKAQVRLRGGDRGCEGVVSGVWFGGRGTQTWCIGSSGLAPAAGRAGNGRVGRIGRICMYVLSQHACPSRLKTSIVCHKSCHYPATTLLGLRTLLPGLPTPFAMFSYN